MSMNIAVTGLSAASTDLNVISDNIANSNTTGFKTSRAEFGDMVNSAVNANGMGVRLLKTSQSFSQGSIANTDNNLDMAISGDGFFQVNTGNGNAYTRAGAFSMSKALGLNPLSPSDTGTGYSYLVNNQSQYLMGYGLTTSPAIATTEVKFDDLILNQNASAPTDSFSPAKQSSYNYSTLLTLYDSEGVNHSLQTFFRKTAANTWDVYNLLDGRLQPTGQDFNAATPIPTVTLGFDATTGVLASTISYDATGTALPSSTDTFKSVIFELGRNATLSPTLRFAASTEGDTFITGIGTVPDGSDVSRTIAGSPDQLLRIDLSSMPPKKTDAVSVNLNLASVQPRTEASTLLRYDITMENKGTDPPSASFTTSQLIYDGKGIAHTLQTTFTPNDPATSDNTWVITYNLLDNNGNPRPGSPYDGGTYTFNDVDVPTFVASAAVPTEVTSIAFSSDALGTGAPAFVASLDISNIKRLNPASTSATSVINRLLATSLTADPAPSANGDPPSMDPSIPSNYNFSTATNIYDSLGNAHIMNVYFRKIADNNWTVYTQFPDVSTLADKIGSLTFDSKGNLLTSRDAFGYINQLKPYSMEILDIRFPNGSTPQNIVLNLDRATQFDSQSITNSITQNGYKDGVLTGVTSDTKGKIIAKYDNDQTQEMGQVVLARFNNNQGLQRIGDNNWVATSESGEPVLRAPGVGVGKLVIKALENSNVDLTAQLVNMISAQRNFQANAQVITTNSTLYQSILGATR